MKRQADCEIGSAPKRLHENKIHGRVSVYLDLVSRLEEAFNELDAAELFHLSHKACTLYSLKANQITQYFPDDMWISIFKIALFHKDHIPKILPYRTVCKNWNKIICSLPRVNASSVWNPSKLMQIFPVLRSLNLMRSANSGWPDFSAWTGLTKLQVREGSVGTRPHPDFTPLTNLAKLTLSSERITSLGSMPSIQHLCLLLPVALDRLTIDENCPNLTKLVSRKASVLTHGPGIYVDDAGVRYEGEFTRGILNGKGTAEYPGRLRYEGEFLSTQPFGHGTMFFTSGDRYVGQCERGLRHGQGEYFWTSGKHFEGTWESGLIRGHGIMTYPSGEKYEGAFQENVYHGFGTFSYANGDCFIGEFAKGKRTHGAMYFGDGAVYNGPIQEGKMTGAGTMKYTDGRDYVGGFRDGKRHGHGILHFVGGGSYEGTFQDDEYHGQGILTHADATTEEGEFSEGRLSTIKL